RLERAVRSVTLERGHDPADFTLVAFGGAGGLHAAELAACLGCRSVLIPSAAGVLSALGCLAADVRRDFSRAVLEPATLIGVDRLALLFEEMELEADETLTAEGVPPERRTTSRALAMRYRGQSYEVDVPADGGSNPASSFHRMHRERYGHCRPDAPVEIVAARVAAVGMGRPPALPEHRPTGSGGPEMRSVWLDAEEVEAESWAWEALPPGYEGHGPALVFGDHATAFVPPGWRWRVNAFGNLILDAVR
ncbi:MAG: hydantoinase/oxoprolinase family protein, partial [Gemmatimonadota bacterium]